MALVGPPLPQEIQSVQLKRMPGAGSRSRQQCRSSPQGAEEEDAARGDFPRDEAARPLRKALRKEGPRKGRSRAPRAQARAQEAAARRPAADEAEAGIRRRPGRRTRRSQRRPRWPRRRSAWSALTCLYGSERADAGLRVRVFILTMHFARARVTNSQTARDPCIAWQIRSPSLFLEP